MTALPFCPPNYLMRLWMSFSRCYPKEGKTVNVELSFPSLAFLNCDHTWKAPSSADVWESVTMVLFPSSKDGFIACSVTRQRVWLKLNLKKILINNRNGENVFKIYRAEYNAFSWLSLLCKHCLLFLHFLFWGIVLLLKDPAVHWLLGMCPKYKWTLTQFSR